MSVGAETLVSDEWIDFVLKNTPAITTIISARSYDGVAPDEADYPHVVFQLQSAIDVAGIGPKARIMTTATYVIQAVAAVDSFTPLKPLARAIDAAFDGVTINRSDGVVLGTVRTEEYRLVEQYEATQIRHLGGIYTVNVQSF